MDDWKPLFLKLIPVFVVIGGLLGVVPLLVYFERKICAWLQDRVGPNRVGLLGPDSPLSAWGINTGNSRILGGLLQPLADAVKLFTKESFIPAGADRLLFTMAPFFALLPPMLAFIVIPVGSDFSVTLSDKTYPVMLQVADLKVGILFILAVLSLSSYGLAFGGWASNNKFSLLGAVRSLAQMISYEIGLGILILAVLMTFDTVSLRDMVNMQAAGGTLMGTWHCDSNWIWGWGVFHQPLAFVLFVVCAFAENNRLPFDLAECEAELVGGFHTEYSSMGFGMFFQGEYIAMLSMGALIATLFLGGWHYPGFGAVHAASPFLAALISLAAFGLKVAAYIFFSMWVRWSLPRFRWDQLMNLGWKTIVPLALANLLLTAFLNLSSMDKRKPARPSDRVTIELQMPGSARRPDCATRANGARISTPGDSV